VFTSYDQVVGASPAFCTASEDCAGTIGAGAYCLEDEHACTADCVSATDCAGPGGEDLGLSCVAGLCRNELRGGDATTLRISATLPTSDPNGAPLQDGTWHFGAITDMFDAVNEGSEANNARPA